MKAEDLDRWVCGGPLKDFGRVRVLVGIYNGNVLAMRTTIGGRRVT